MMKESNKYYSLVKTGIDDFELTIHKTGRIIKFKRNIGFVRKIQSSNIEGRLLLVRKMKEAGLTKDDFISRTTRVENGKEVVKYDDSMYREIEREAIKEAKEKVASDAIDEVLKESYINILLEMAIEKNDQEKIAKKFMEDLFKCMVNSETDTPRSIERRKQEK